MKKYIVLPVLLICLLVASEMIAQSGYTPPSRERVEELLEQIEECKRAQKQFQSDLKNMEENSENYTLKEYNDTKRFAQNAKMCANILRLKLDELRKDYPGWFNSPNATIGVMKPKRKTLTPHDIEEALDKVGRAIDRALARFEAISVPDH